MNSKQIELYLAAARTENLTWAAEKSFVSKATMSRQLAALEEELGYRLFYHLGNSIRLTPEGEILKDTLEKMQFLMQKGLQEMEDVHRGRRGHLVLGFTSDMCIPDAYLREIDTFRRKYPDIRVSYVSKPFTDYFNDLESGAIDIVLSHNMSLMKYKTLEHLPVAEARRKLYYGIRHPLARKKDLSIRDFAEDIHWASVHADTPDRLRIIMICRSFRPNMWQQRMISSFICCWGKGSALWMILSSRINRMISGSCRSVRSCR